jgi:hypothetical protein
VRRNPLEGGVSPRARRDPLEGGVSPRARRNLLEGALALERGGTCSRGLWLGRSDGPWGPPQRGPCRVCVFRREVRFVLFFAGFKQGSPGF